MPQPIEQQKEGWKIELAEHFIQCFEKNALVDIARVLEIVRSQRQSAGEEVLLKAKGAIQELINISNENASNAWYDGLRASKSVIEVILKIMSSPQE